MFTGSRWSTPSWEGAAGAEADREAGEEAAGAEVDREAEEEAEGRPVEDRPAGEPAQWSSTCSA